MPALPRRGARRAAPAGASAASSARPRRVLPRARFAARDRAAVLLESLAPPRMGRARPETGDELVFPRPGVPGCGAAQAAPRPVPGRGRDRSARPDAGAGASRRSASFSRRRCGWRPLRARGARQGAALGHRGPVLPSLVGSLLPRLDAVLAFAGAREVDGGTGAISFCSRRAQSDRLEQDARQRGEPLAAADEAQTLGGGRLQVDAARLTARS